MDEIASKGIHATLDDMVLGKRFVVHGVSAPASDPEWRFWLEEIGFIAGERGHLMARGMPGGCPLVVRIGVSTFALRRAEASCIAVMEAQHEPQQ
jgi:ferrous iron transport protein A